MNRHPGAFASNGRERSLGASKARGVPTRKCLAAAPARWKLVVACDRVGDKATYRYEGDIADEADNRPENGGVSSTLQEDPNEDSGPTHPEWYDELAPRSRRLTRIDTWILHPSRIGLRSGTPFQGKARAVDSEGADGHLHGSWDGSSISMSMTTDVSSRPRRAPRVRPGVKRLDSQSGSGRSGCAATE
jgi:hypothetical protein